MAAFSPLFKTKEEAGGSSHLGSAGSTRTRLDTAAAAAAQPIPTQQPWEAFYRRCCRPSTRRSSRSCSWASRTGAPLCCPWVRSGAGSHSPRRLVLLQWQDDAAERDGHGPPRGDVPHHRSQREAGEKRRRTDEVLGYRRAGTRTGKLLEDGSCVDMLAATRADWLASLIFVLGSELATTPLLVLANKIDLEPHISEPELIRELNLDYIVDNPWLVIPISALRLVNIDQVIQWLMKQSGKG
ncbi:unnamed protein product [Phytophthora fragariaefolia]|uniref:Unnamed protein product n=1 Tax=Phytophthora fragariaefolia TaxID=1490495 RepID=A0A9W6WZM0_9STRA|nr:unnamed protein product [Phytophthora fragariaefolia]